MTSETSVVLDVSDLCTMVQTRYAAVRPVDGVSFQVRQGETVGVVGESGCGKTMTALSIMRLLPKGGRIDSGEVTLAGQPLTDLSEAQMRLVRGRDIGMIFQDPLSALNPTMPVGLQVAEPLRLHRRMPVRHAHARVLELLEMVGLPDPRRQVRAFPHQLSGGMRQRVMIAMALACEPRLLIADEPTTGLDVTIQRQILDLIDDLKARLGMAVILVTHDLGMIAGRADRVAVMYAGKIVEQSGTASLFGSPAHQYTAALFAALPERTAGPGERLFSIPGRPPEMASLPPGCRFAPRCQAATQECLDAEPVLTQPLPRRLVACFHPLAGPAQPWRCGPAGHAPAQGGAVVMPRPETPQDPRPGAVREPAPTELLRMESVSKSYQSGPGLWRSQQRGMIHAVTEVSLSLRPGETIGLVGESGCGKSTMGRLIVGLERPDAGTINFGGQDLHQLRGPDQRRMRRDLQLMFQDSAAALDPRRTVRASIAEPLVIQHIGDRQAQRDRVDELLNDVGLPASAGTRYPHEFSGGQRQRIALARSLALGPRLIVADEPVSALDVSVQAQILNLMVELQRHYSLTYLLISHDLAVVRYMASTIAVMYLGNLIEIGPGDAVYTRPAHPYTRGLIDSAPTADPGADKKQQRRGIVGELPSPADPPSGCRFRTRCPRAQEICARERPTLRAFTVADHLAACHFPLEPPLSAA